MIGNIKIAHTKSEKDEFYKIYILNTKNGASTQFVIGSERALIMIQVLGLKIKNELKAFHPQTDVYE